MVEKTRKGSKIGGNGSQEGSDSSWSHRNHSTKLGDTHSSLSPGASFPYCSEWCLRFAKALHKASRTQTIAPRWCEWWPLLAASVLQYAIGSARNSRLLMVPESCASASRWLPWALCSSGMSSYRKLPLFLSLVKVFCSVGRDPEEGKSLQFPAACCSTSVDGML